MNLTNYANALIPFAWGTYFILQGQHSSAYRRAGILFLCIFVTLLKPLVDTHHSIALSMALQLFFPFTAVAVPLLYLNYLFNFVSDKRPVYRWLNMVFVIPLALWLISGYVFFVHYPEDVISRNFYGLMAGTADNSVALAQKVYHITLAAMYMFMALTVIVSGYLIPKTNDRKQKSNGEKRECFHGVNIIATAIAIGAILYHLPWVPTGWMVWLLGPGLLSLGYMMYRNRFSEKMARETIAKQHIQNEHMERLMKYFSEARPWLNPLLRENDVIKALSMNRTDFWKLLKQTPAGNFSDFVNGYRVEETKRLIRSGHDYEKTGNIAQMAGFNSYSTFLRAFRKIARCSPQEYGGDLQVKVEAEMGIRV